MEVREEVVGNKIPFIVAGGLFDVLARLLERRNVSESSTLEVVYFLKSVRGDPRLFGGLGKKRDEWEVGGEKILEHLVLLISGLAGPLGMIKINVWGSKGLKRGRSEATKGGSGVYPSFGKGVSQLITWYPYVRGDLLERGAVFAMYGGIVFLRYGSKLMMGDRQSISL